VEISVAGMDEAEARFHAVHGWLNREEAHSRHVIGNAKLVSTFSATLAATFLSVAVADTANFPWDVAAGMSLVLALAITLALIAMKRKDSVDGDTIKGKSAGVVHDAAIAAALTNKGQADHAHNLLVIQIALSLLSCGFAVVPMMHR